MKTTRRKFIENSLKTTAIVASSPIIAAATSHSSILGNSVNLPGALQFSQVPLPYGYNALEPSIDATTMDIHYNKHHTAYIKNVNEAITADKISFGTEKEFFSNASKLSAKAKNNGGGAWNHNFFWQVMHPSKEMKTPGGKLADAINGSFDSFDKFKEQFTQAAMTRFGSGWAWLVNENGKLKIGSTANQDNPLMDTSELKGTPILGLDVWEHAYYLKYQNKRNEYVANWWNVVNWEEVAKRLA
ncbi:MAG TPA: superoxide dismutase [Chryseolinea sp.]|nr:superoxide dismutase [Chryseolinea sp.]